MTVETEETLTEAMEDLVGVCVCVVWDVESFGLLRECANDSN